jgi:hypothetical protein
MGINDAGIAGRHAAVAAVEHKTIGRVTDYRPEIAREIGDRMPIIERLRLARSIEARPSVVQSGADRHQVLRRVSAMR